jgi:hypothetical protein
MIYEVRNSGEYDMQTIETSSSVIESLQADETNPMSNLEKVNQIQRDESYFVSRECRSCMKSGQVI